MDYLEYNLKEEREHSRMGPRMMRHKNQQNQGILAGAVSDHVWIHSWDAILNESSKRVGAALCQSERSLNVNP